jgi:hypothetical protein
MPLNSGVKVVDKPMSLIGLRIFERPLITNTGPRLRSKAAVR